MARVVRADVPYFSDRAKVAEEHLLNVRPNDFEALPNILKRCGHCGCLSRVPAALKQHAVPETEFTPASECDATVDGFPGPVDGGVDVRRARRRVRQGAFGMPSEAERLDKYRRVGIQPEGRKDPMSECSAQFVHCTGHRDSTPTTREINGTFTLLEAERGILVSS